MERLMPGTLLKWPDGAEDTAFEVFGPTFALSGGGLQLSQIVQLTGLTATGIQNWVKRGWVSHPVDKRYDPFQVARILVLNMLRPAMQLERIVKLLAILNGRVDDRSDDMISEQTLYTMLCSGIYRMEKDPPGDRAELERLASSLLAGYEGPVPGARERVQQVLVLMLLSLNAARMIGEAEELYKTVCTDSEEKEGDPA